MSNCAHTSLNVEKDETQIRPIVECSILRALSYQGNECGGIIGMDKDSVEINRFYYDRDANCTRFSYRPNRDRLKSVIADWNKEDAIFIGLIHAHPDDAPFLSCRDLAYAQAMLMGNPWMNELRMYVVCSGRIMKYIVRVPKTSNHNAVRNID